MRTARARTRTAIGQNEEEERGQQGKRGQSKGGPREEIGEGY